MAKFKRIITIAVSLFLIIIILVISNISPFVLMRTEEKIKRHILFITPIGTDMEEVIKTIEKKRKWRIKDFRYDRGFYNHFSSEPGRIIGKKYLVAWVGNYRLPPWFFSVDVDVAWCFDKNGKLIDVFVRKTVDSL